MTNAPVLKLLIDTNIWMEYFTGRSQRAGDAAKLLDVADRSEEIAVYASSLSVKDVAYLVASSIKREVRRERGVLDKNAVSAADEAAWSCIRLMRTLAIIAPVGADEVFDSFVFKPYHNDFEDDLILGVANRIDADYVVTEDKSLIKHTNGVCIDIATALERLSSL